MMEDDSQVPVAAGTGKEDLPITDLNPTPVHWEPLDYLQPSPYIDYKGLILNRRAYDLNPPPPNYFNVSVP